MSQRFHLQISLSWAQRRTNCSNKRSCLQARWSTDLRLIKHLTLRGVVQVKARHLQSSVFQRHWSRIKAALTSNFLCLACKRATRQTTTWLRNHGRTSLCWANFISSRMQSSITLSKARLKMPSSIKGPRLQQKLTKWAAIWWQPKVAISRLRASQRSIGIASRTVWTTARMSYLVRSKLFRALQEARLRCKNSLRTLEMALIVRRWSSRHSMRAKEVRLHWLGARKSRWVAKSSGKTWIAMPYCRIR